MWRKNFGHLFWTLGPFLRLHWTLPLQHACVNLIKWAWKSSLCKAVVCQLSASSCAHLQPHTLCRDILSAHRLGTIDKRNGNVRHRGRCWEACWIKEALNQSAVIHVGVWWSVGAVVFKGSRGSHTIATNVFYWTRCWSFLLIGPSVTRRLQNLKVLPRIFVSFLAITSMHT